MPDSAFALQILDTAEDGFAFLDQQLRTLYSNPAAARLLGRMDGGFEAACRRAIAEGVSVETECCGVELRITPAQGGLIVRLHEDGSVSRALQAGGAGAWDWDLATGAAWWSPEMYELWGVEPGTPMHKANSMELVDPRDRESVSAAVEECIRSHAAAQWEFRVQHPARGERSITSFARVLSDRAGHAERMLGVSVDTTERSRAEEQLREQREWLRVTLSSIGDAVIAADIAGRVTFLNDVAAALTGWPREEAEGQPVESVFRIVNERTRMPAEDIITRVLQDGRVLNLANHTALLTRDGREVPIEDSAAPIRDQGGQVAGVVLVFRDVTAQRRAREAVRRSEELARQRLAEIEDIYRNAPIGLCVLDRDLRFLRINERLAETNGLPAGEHVGRTVREVLPRLADVVEPLMRRVLETGEPLLNLEIKSETPAQPGVQRTWLEHWLPVKDASGAAVKLSVVVEETTERKREEAALRAALAEAEEGRRLLDALMENVPEGITIADAPDLRIRLVSRYGQELLSGPHAGRTTEEVVRSFPLYRGDGVTPLPASESPLARAIGRGEVVQNQEIVQETADGRRISLLCNAAPIRDREGNIAAGIVAWRDITARKRAEAALAAERELLERIVESIPVMLCIYDPRLQRFQLNRESERVMGWTTAQANEGDFMAGVYPDPAYRAEVAGYMQSLAPGWREWNITARDGSTIPGDWANIRLSDDRIVGIGIDLRARKDVEARLRESQERLRLALDGAEIGTFEYVPATGEISCDDRSRLLWGLPPGGRLDLPAAMVRIHPEDRRRAAESLSQACSGGAFDSEYRVVWPDGSVHWTAAKGRAYFEGEGECRRAVRLAGIHVDITERKRLEEELRRRAEEVETVMAVAPVAIWVAHDPECREIVGNPTANWFYEAGAGENVSANLSAVRSFYAGGRQLAPEELPMQQAAASGVDIRDSDLAVRLPSGRRIDMLGHASPLRDAAGQVRGCVGAFLDITQRKRNEERIQHYAALLEGRSRIFREALSSDTEEELGRSCLSVAEELTGSRFGFIAEIGADGRLHNVAVCDPGWEACRMETPSGANHQPAGFAIHGIYGRVLLDGKGSFTNAPATHPDSVGTPAGHPTLTAFLGVPLVHAGKTIGMVGLGNREGGYRPEDLEAMETLACDIVEVFMRKRAERAVRAGEERLRQAQKMESIGLLAGGIAHDFNNLLATIMGNASLLDEDVPDEGRERLDAILKSTERAADLTRQLLAYAGKGRLMVEPLDLSGVVRDMTGLLRSSLPKMVTVELDLAAGLPGIEADRGQLQQIVMNLVINAAEAIGPDQVGTVRVHTGAREVSEADQITDETTGRPLTPGTYICFEVRDTGCGMDPETRSKVFDPFFTTKFMGRGLGLAAVAGIVQAQQGAIQVETAPLEGTTFRVLLPAAGVEATQPT